MRIHLYVANVLGQTTTIPRRNGVRPRFTDISCFFCVDSVKSMSGSAILVDATFMKTQTEVGKFGTHGGTGVLTEQDVSYDAPCGCYPGRGLRHPQEGT